jgi:hypothetical protein
MDTLNKKVNIPLSSQIAYKLLLYLIKIVEGKLLGNFRWRGKARAFRSALVKPLQARIINRLAYRFTSIAAEILLLPLYLAGDHLIRRKGKTAVKAGRIGCSIRQKRMR